ncbi:MAG TPA: DUF2158 domain-containing protein [Chitinophagaceae bacterium]|nr:DUF2158 domain-containing protein [Chitinophagaceae bacterium]
MISFEIGDDATALDVFLDDDGMNDLLENLQYIKKHKDHVHLITDMDSSVETVKEGNELLTFVTLYYLEKNDLQDLLGEDSRLLTDKYFKIGAVVKLRSGGPEMTIVELESSNQSSLKVEAGSLSTNSRNVICQWFEGDSLKTGTFRIAALKKIKTL